ncbi:hypothetical protein [Archaeoglobus sp.]|nr:hypothetical protein [Archaeoglobus sp.]MDI3498226.1 hypothetical protein [Archaeoglobus sp.]
MVRVETRRFVEENVDLIKFVEEHGSPEMRKIALALRLAVELENKR